MTTVYRSLLSPQSYPIPSYPIKYHRPIPFRYMLSHLTCSISLPPIPPHYSPYHPIPSHPIKCHRPIPSSIPSHAMPPHLFHLMTSKSTTSLSVSSHPIPSRHTLSHLVSSNFTGPIAFHYVAFHSISLHPTPSYLTCPISSHSIPSHHITSLSIPLDPISHLAYRNSLRHTMRCPVSCLLYHSVSPRSTLWRIISFTSQSILSHPIPSHLACPIPLYTSHPVPCHLHNPITSHPIVSCPITLHHVTSRVILNPVFPSLIPSHLTCCIRSHLIPSHLSHLVVVVPLHHILFNPILSDPIYPIYPIYPIFPITSYHMHSDLVPSNPTTFRSIPSHPVLPI